VVFDNNILFVESAPVHVEGSYAEGSYIEGSYVEGNDKRLFNNDDPEIKFRKFCARLSTHEYSISVITLLPQRVIHFGAVSNNFTTFCINKMVAELSSIYGSFL